ncbi:hypothetical protein ABPG72_015579 [Tetrahymena utriculariae]
MNQLNQSTIEEDEKQSLEILQGFKLKYAELEEVVDKKTSERQGIIEDIDVLEKRLKDLRKSLIKKKELRDKYCENIETSEKALNRIADSTKTLLDFVTKKNQVLDREANM